MRSGPLLGFSPITLILRLVVGGAFVFAGVLKMADPAKFAIDVTNYRLLPHEMIHLVAILVPGIEVVAGLFVLAGFRLKAAALVITGLTVMFFVVIVSALARGLNIECGCFGTVGGKHVGLLNLAIDSTLFCLAALLAKRAEGSSPPLSLSEDSASGRTGYQPVPSGDSPDGMTRAFFANPDAGFVSMASSIPVGGSPIRTGESPVPPIARTTHLTKVKP